MPLEGNTHLKDADTIAHAHLARTTFIKDKPLCAENQMTRWKEMQARHKCGERYISAEIDLVHTPDIELCL